MHVVPCEGNSSLVEGENLYIDIIIFHQVAKLSFPGPKEFYEQFKNDPEAARRAAFQVGQKMGQALKQRFNIQGEDLEAVAEILNATMKTVQGEPSARVEDGKVIMRNSGFCAIMRAALTLKVPWEWLDTNFAWPWLEGIVSIIRPDIKLSIQAARNRGDQVCIHVFEIE
jgi:hypothetical protein